jgi:hypothetical protein
MTLTIAHHGLQVARQYHYLLESSIVLSFQTYMGGKVSEKLRDKSLQKSQGLLHEQIPIYQRFLSYFSLYSFMLLLGTTPLGVQRFVVHTIQPFAVAGLGRLMTTVIRNPWLSFIPLSLLLIAVLRTLYRAHQKSLLHQSKIGIHSSSINYTRKSVIQALQPASADLAGGDDLEAPSDKKESEIRPAVSSCLELTIMDPEISMSRPRLGLGVESMDEEVGESKETERKKLSARSASSLSRTKSRPLYRGMFSLPDDDEAEDEKLQKVNRRTKERRESTRSNRRKSREHRRGSQDQRSSSLTGGLQRTFSHLLRMVSISEDVEKKDNEEVEFDHPELSDEDSGSFSSDGSRFDYSLGVSSDDSEWSPSSAED